MVQLQISCDTPCAQLLDLMEVYLRWRPLHGGGTMGYLRIDGSTSLEDRCAAMPFLTTCSALLAAAAG